MMLVDRSASVLSASPEAVAQVRHLEHEVLKLPQVPITTEHTLHAGLYARTIRIPAGVLLTGALIRIPTLLILDGEVVVYAAEGPVHLSGHHVLRGEVGRKQAFLALADTAMTMVFPTAATTIEHAENEFTDEAERLCSRREGAVNTMKES
ncbi:hypothetical protein [Insolitispirillum peregrinum]|uniref:hypothetical protein n=1 Tax=Insolitispirillum peregrinum TaxID=80876 RepID=UPI003608D186